MIHEHKAVSPDEYKNVIKNILSYIHKFCLYHGIKYFVAYGSLIGVVRHKGFIPWDDDIDICMLREDYERFIDLMLKNTDRYYVLESRTSKFYYNNFARVCDSSCILELSGVGLIDNLGAFVDVFPLDNVPSDKAERNQLYRDIKKIRKSIMYSLPWKYLKRKSLKGKLLVLAHPYLRIKSRYLIGISRLKQERDKLLQKYNNEKTALVACLFDIPSDSLVIPVEELKEIIEENFEDIKVMIPSQYDKILKRTYGNYLEYPPLEQRISRHHYTAYWK